MLNNIRKLEKRVLKEDVSQYKRYLLKTIDFTSKIIGITGPRGVGKTTLLLQYANLLKKIFEPYKSLYFSYDYLINSDIKLLELAGEVNKVGIEYLVVDEIHKYSDFRQELRGIHESYPNLKVIFSATCAVDFNKQDSLSNIVDMYSIKGLSYREFLELKLNIKLPTFSLEDIMEDSVYIINKLEDKFTPLEHFSEYLSMGYYPFHFKENNNYIGELNDVVTHTIDSDLLSLGLVKVNFINKLKKLMVLISQESPYELNVTKIATSMSLSRNTIYAYLRHLERGGLLNTLRSSKKSLGKLAKPERIYLNNTNIFYSLASQEKIETMRETFLISQLKQNFSIKLNSDGDFLVNEMYILKVDIKNNDFKQTRIENSPYFYLIVDTDSTEDKHKIPLWLFGFLY